MLSGALEIRRNKGDGYELQKKMVDEESLV